METLVYGFCHCTVESAVAAAVERYGNACEKGCEIPLRTSEKTSIGSRCEGDLRGPQVADGRTAKYR